ncbi:hypothetical protein [Streptomyces mirabilis]
MNRHAVYGDVVTDVVAELRRRAEELTDAVRVAAAWTAPRRRPPGT